MKKAYLVTFSITTRVIADVSKEFDPNNSNLIIPENHEYYSGIISEAAKHVIDCPEGYLSWDNIDDVSEDTECPYDPNYDDDNI